MAPSLSGFRALGCLVFVFPWRFATLLSIVAAMDESGVPRFFGQEGMADQGPFGPQGALGPRGGSAGSLVAE